MVIWATQVNAAFPFLGAKSWRGMTGTDSQFMLEGTFGHDMA